MVISEHIGVSSRSLSYEVAAISEIVQQPEDLPLLCVHLSVQIMKTRELNDDRLADNLYGVLLFFQHGNATDNTQVRCGISLRYDVCVQLTVLWKFSDVERVVQVCAYCSSKMLFLNKGLRFTANLANARQVESKAISDYDAMIKVRQASNAA